MQQSPKSHEIDHGKSAVLGNFQSQWSDDIGVADQIVRSALASGDLGLIIPALAQSRLFIALVAEVTGELRVGEKNADMSVACLTARDGRLGLLCFTGLDSLTAWNPSARPVPLNAADAADAALDENAQAIIIDLAGVNPATLTLADVVLLSGKDQRGRAMLILGDLLGDLGEQVTCEMGSDALLHVNVPEPLLGLVHDIVRTHSALHSYVPAGIAILPITSG
jgi:hypothetical protein